MTTSEKLSIELERFIQSAQSGKQDATLADYIEELKHLLQNVQKTS
ncbi:hypothetical protein [Aureibacillus halotolerans]|uniref:Uncharacterized protein n=1 Tax=Aureibacillus halotolerans TaxID=1508390 RepID=A0A4R6TU48_9BACI|nr:hypothetical protein [Aureibacillus halotolerans]TDQ36092.1 hypothetical protein EV213_12023 [Aureibacillus halotolerans]